MLAFVALLALVWPQVVLTGCDRAPAAPGHESHTSLAPEHAHEGPQCLVVMTCNAPMTESLAIPGVVQPTALPQLHPRPSTTVPATTVLTAEPPPPRRLA